MKNIPENMTEQQLLQKILSEEMLLFVEENKEKIVKRAEKKLRALLIQCEKKLEE